MKRVKTLFLINGEAVVIEQKQLTLDEVEKMKWVVAEECEANIHDIEVAVEVSTYEMSEYDVSCDGLVDYKGGYPDIVDGVTLVGSIDDLLESYTTGNVEKSLEFTLDI